MKKMYKVLTPVERKHGNGTGGTFWMRLGTAYDAKDGALSVFLDALPPSGRLYIRELDEEDLAARGGRRTDHASGVPAMPVPTPASNQESVPF